MSKPKLGPKSFSLVGFKTEFPFLVLPYYYILINKPSMNNNLCILTEKQL